MSHKVKPVFDRETAEAETQPVLGIHFGDNDFHTSIRAFLGILVGNEVWHVRLFKNLTKASVVEVYNEIIYGLYLVTQRLDRGALPDAKEKEHMTKYLAIKESNVFLGQEVIDHYNELMASRNYNGDYHFIVGLEVHTL